MLVRFPGAANSGQQLSPLSLKEQVEGTRTKLGGSDHMEAVTKRGLQKKNIANLWTWLGLRARGNTYLSHTLQFSCQWLI